jgi:hypothetical protein
VEKSIGYLEAMVQGGNAAKKSQAPNPKFQMENERKRDGREFYDDAF